MRIAQVFPRQDPDLPELDAEARRVVEFLSLELARQGHEVTVHEAASSTQDAPGSGFDLAHVHLAAPRLPEPWQRAGIPVVATLHGVPEPAGDGLSAEVPLVAVSSAQRAWLPSLRWKATVSHGVPEDLYRPGPGRGGYLAALGSLNAPDGIGRAIEIARRAGRRLRIAKSSPDEGPYFRSEIAPLLADPHVTCVEAMNESDRNVFLGDALAVLRPAVTPRSLDLTAVEALACGTPVISCGPGPLEEWIEHGVTGFAVRNLPEAVTAVASVGDLDRRRCRESFEQRFTAGRMASRYVEIYADVVREFQEGMEGRILEETAAHGSEPGFQGGGRRPRLGMTLE